MATADNATFLATANRFTPEQRFISAFFAQAYAAVHMIARGMAATEVNDAEAVLQEAKAKTFAAPFGPLRIHAETNHAILTPQIGRAAADGSFTIVNRAAAPIVPDPYLVHADRGEASARTRVPYLKVVK
jgi:branched-chain amino acid transport system substrate-binding protein